VFEALQRSNAKGRLERAFAVARAINPLAFEVKGLLARHLCVLTAGLLEESLRLHLSEYARVNSRGFVGNFVSEGVAKLTNLHSERLSAILGTLDTSLRDEMSAFLDDRRKSALNSLVARRHEVAHGKDGGVSLATAEEYKAVVLEILEKLDEIFVRI
jgi:hypothetical protein